jgi:hypothetical protein
MGYDVRNVISGKRLEIRAGDQRVVVDRKCTDLYVPPGGDIRARRRADKVYILMGTKQLEMTTPVATKIGFALVKNGGFCIYLGDVVSFEIGGEEFTLLPAVAVQLGGAILKKADVADDYQRRLT